MAKEDNTQIYLAVAIGIIVIAIAAYLLFKYRDRFWSSPPDGDWQPGDEDGDTDPYEPPGYRTLKFEKTVRDKKSITWDLDGEYYATLLTGMIRPGGSSFIYTNIKIFVMSNGNWKHVKTIGGWPGGLTQFETTAAMTITKVKWSAEQGILPWLGDRYVDEVHAQLLVEV